MVVHCDGLGLFCLWDRRGGDVIVGEDVLDEPFSHVIFDGGDVVPHAVTVGFAVLGGDVADVNPGGGGGYEAQADALNQEVRQAAGVEGYGAVAGERWRVD